MHRSCKYKKENVHNKRRPKKENAEYSHNYGIKSLPITTNALEIPKRVEEAQLNAMIDKEQTKITCPNISLQSSKLKQRNKKRRNLLNSQIEIYKHKKTRQK